MSKTDVVKDFWQEFCQQNSDVNIDELYQVWFFHNNQAGSVELADLVLQGKKTATASLVTVNELMPEIAPINNGFSVVTDFNGSPLCVIQTTEIRHLPFDEVDAQFAFDEGEGNQTLENWRNGHWKYFTRESQELDIEFNEKSLVACERFRLLFAK
jgi:uncharacterized protein YhfF